MVFLTVAQRDALKALSDRYKVQFDVEHYHRAFDLPEGWVEGWVGGTHDTIFVGCSPDGEIHS